MSKQQIAQDPKKPEVTKEMNTKSKLHQKLMRIMKKYYNRSVNSMDTLPNP